MAAALGVALSFGTAAQPSAPVGVAAAPGDAEATLSWTDPSDDAITSYSVRHAANEAALSSEAWAVVPGSDAATVGHTVPSLTNGTRYYFQVRAASADGDSPPSNVATIRLAASPTAVVTINDSRLRETLERELGVAAGASITQLDVATLADRFGDYIRGITDLTGLEYAVNLKVLNLTGNAVSDVSVFGSGSLESLTFLYLSGNEISDVSALGSLQSLTTLWLDRNEITDISALGSLQSLTRLALAGNAISDVSALGSLTSLSEAYLGDNAISDISALGSLQSLLTLWLGRNEITDVTALGSLESLTTLVLDDNAITDVSALGSLQSLTGLFLQDNEITDVSALGSLIALRALDLSGNTISDVSALGSLESLTTLVLDDNAITDVSALGSLIALRTLYLSGNTISDVSALGSLQSLTWLYLTGNTISDISALGSLQSLTWLDLSGNTISDISTLGSLQSLTWLYLSGNTISDISALGSLQSLTWLHLSGNTISDVSALGSLQSLTRLHLSGNTISDVSALGSLQSLRRLDLGGNRIADVAPVIGAGFGVVGLRGNPLSADSIERHVPALRAAGTAVVAGWPVLIFPSAADPSGRQGFVRVVNRSAVGGEVLIDAVDDAGERFGPLRLAIGAGEAAHFNSQDLEAGNAAKGLSGGVGVPTDGVWHLALSSTLDIEVLSYVRTPDGFLTSVHDTLPREGSVLHAAVFNPGSNSA